jgi:predicted dehydrogenase
MSDMTRRNFIGASGAAAGMALATTIHGKAHGDSGKIRLGIIGTGARGQQHLREGLWGSKDFEIVAVADPYTPHLKSGMQYGWVANAGMATAIDERPTPAQLTTLKGFTKPTTHLSHLDMLAHQRLDAVLIATPPHAHAAIVTDCLKVGLHVFCETPMATAITDARDLVAKARESGLIVQVGHQRRYHPNYNLAFNPNQREGKIGRLVQVNLYDHQNSDGRNRDFDSLSTRTTSEFKDWEAIEHRLNWRVYARPDSGPCLHALPSSIDTANWCCGVVPTRVFASGGTSYWLDGRDTPDNIIAIFDYTIPRDGEGFRIVDGRSYRQDIHALNRSYALRCVYSYSLINAEFGVCEHIRGDWASVALSITEPSKRTLESWVDVETDFPHNEREEIKERYRKLLEEMTPTELRAYEVSRGKSAPPPPEFDRHSARNWFINALGSEESADVHQFRAFAEHIRNGGTPRANVMVGLAAVIAGESAKRSYETGQPVDIDPALMEFDFETPSISLYDTNAAPILGTTELM